VNSSIGLVAWQRAGRLELQIDHLQAQNRDSALATFLLFAICLPTALATWLWSETTFILSKPRTDLLLRHFYPDRILKLPHEPHSQTDAMAERYIPEHRRTQFKAKNSFKPDELRRRREEQQVEIRRQKREENLSKRRGIARGDGEIGVGSIDDADSDDDAGILESEVGHDRVVEELCTDRI
jgi:hypothetical protein